MFLWVHLVLATIKDQESIQDLHRAVDRLPAGLSGVYEYTPEFMHHLFIRADTSTFLPGFGNTETNNSD